MSAQGRGRSTGIDRVAQAAAVAVVCALIGVGCGGDSPTTEGSVAPLPPTLVAVVSGAPGPTARISPRDLRRATVQAEASRNVSHPDAKERATFESTGLEQLIEAAWARGQARAMKIELTKGELENAVTALEKDTFEDPAVYRSHVRALKLSPRDVRESMRTFLLKRKVQESVEDGVPPPDEGELAAYYEEVREEKFTSKPSRNLRVIANADPKVLLAVKRRLERDDSPAEWKRLARRYTEDKVTKGIGGLASLEVGQAEEAMDAAVFKAKIGAIEGIVEGGKGRKYVFEVLSERDGGTKPLSEVRSRVKSELEEKRRAARLKSFSREFEERWRGRTECRPDHLVRQCGNYEGGEAGEGSKPSPEV